MPEAIRFLNLPVRRCKSYVYRIVSMKRLYELFESKHNALVSPAMWDDPFENFILRSQKVPRRGWFGQCWTRHNASDAMWRIYSNDSRGVRLRSTPARLVESLDHTLSAGSRGFIGAVRYLPQHRLNQFVRRALLPGSLNDIGQAAKTLLVKRPAFRHEAEIRLLLFRPSDHSTGKIAKYMLDPNKVIDQLMLDPRLANEEAERLKAQIRRRTGFKGSIKHSRLYAPPSLLELSGSQSGSPSNKRLQPTAARAMMSRRG